MANTENDIHVFMETEQTTPNSFIANVNYLVQHFQELQDLVKVPEEVEKIKVATEQLKYDTSAIRDDATAQKRQAIEIKNQTEDIRVATLRIESTVNAKLDDAQSIVDTAQLAVDRVGLKIEDANNIFKKTDNILEESKEILTATTKEADRAKDYAEIAMAASNRADATNKLAAGVKNQQVIYQIGKGGIKKLDVIVFPDISYYVGRGVLHLNWEGVDLYPNLHYEELGRDGEISHSIKFLIDIPEYNLLKFWIVTSNIVGFVEQKMEEMNQILESTDGLTEVAKDYIHQMHQVLETIDSSIKLESGVGNNDQCYTSGEEGIKAGDIVELPGITYYVGLNALRINWEGIELFRNIHYEEVGTEQEVSHCVKFLIDIPPKNTLNAWSVSSNITQEVEGINATFTEVKGMRDEVKIYQDSIKDLGDTAKEYADKAQKAYELAADSVVLHKCNIPFVTIEDINHEKVPSIDCIFVYTVDMDCRDTPEREPVNNNTNHGLTVRSACRNAQS